MKKKTAKKQKNSPELKAKKNYFGGLKKLGNTQPSKSSIATAAAIGTAAYFGKMEKLFAGLPT